MKDEKITGNAVCGRAAYRVCREPVKRKTVQKDQKPAARWSRRNLSLRRKPTRRKKKAEKRRTARTIGNISRSRQTVSIIFPWDDIQIPEGSAIVMIGKDSGSGFWKRVKAGAEQAVTDLNSALGYTGDAR